MLSYITMKRRAFVQPCDKPELQTADSHWNTYKVNIVWPYWCANCSHRASPSPSLWALVRQAIRWMQITSAGNPGSVPSACIKLTATQKEGMYFALNFGLLPVVLLCIAVSMRGRLLEGIKAILLEDHKSSQPILDTWCHRRNKLHGLSLNEHAYQVSHAVWTEEKQRLSCLRQPLQKVGK